MLPSQVWRSGSVAVADDEARPLRYKRASSARSRNDSSTSKPHRLLFSTPKAASYLAGGSKMMSFKSSPLSTVSTNSSAEASESNVLQWMQHECPMDVVPRIVAYAGPQLAWNLNRTNQFWRNVFAQESTWRTMCEELYKWKEGDEIPNSWKNYYRHSPCVPIDYRSIPAALAIASDKNEATVHDASNMNPRVMEQRRSLRLLLRPGDYFLKEAITIQAVGNIRVSVETMQLPSIAPIVEAEEGEDGSASAMDVSTSSTASASPAKRMLKKATSIRKVLSCRHMNSVLDAGVAGVGIGDDADRHSSAPVPPQPRRASLISKTRRHNEPIIRVRQGICLLRDLNIVHNAHGLDIWNGNAAVQIQPPMGPDETPLNTRPKVILERVDVASRSGRGIVNIDGGVAQIMQCCVHHCAATGIYVGGPGSHAVIRETDVVQNGNGNRLSRRGIGRGHSGIYLEQGRAIVSDCNISRNSLTGISAVSQENAILNLENSDLVANGSVQLEMPPNGSLSHRRSLTQNNNVASTGLSRSRSGLMDAELQSTAAF